MKRFIRLNESGVIVGIRFDTEIVEGEIESQEGELGQIMQSDGTFITPKPKPVAPKATIEEQILAESQYQAALLEMTILGGI